jgi:hypothetical protein
MAKHGIDEGSLNAEVFVQAHEWFSKRCSGITFRLMS